MPQNEIMLNECQFMGRVREDPQSSGENIFFFLRTKCLHMDKNGQFTEIPQDIPMMVTPGGPINPVKNFVKAGKQLYVRCHYRFMEEYATVVFVVERIMFGK